MDYKRMMSFDDESPFQYVVLVRQWHRDKRQKIVIAMLRTIVQLVESYTKRSKIYQVSFSTLDSVWPRCWGKSTLMEKLEITLLCYVMQVPWNSCSLRVATCRQAQICTVPPEWLR